MTPDLKERVGRIAIEVESRIDRRLRRLSPPPTLDEVEEVKQRALLKLIAAAPGLGEALLDQNRMACWMTATAYHEWVGLLREKHRSRGVPADAVPARAESTPIDAEDLRDVESALSPIFAFPRLLDRISGDEGFPRKTPPGRPTVRVLITRLVVAIEALKDALGDEPIVLAVPQPARDLPRERRRGASG